MFSQKTLLLALAGSTDCLVGCFVALTFVPQADFASLSVVFGLSYAANLFAQYFAWFPDQPEELSALYALGSNLIRRFLG